MNGLYKYKESQMLLEKIESKKPQIIKNKKTNKYIHIRFKQDIFGHNELKKLASFVKYIIINKMELPSYIKVRLDIDRVIDMPTIVVLEQLIYTLIKETNVNITLDIQYDKNNSLNNYIEYSILKKASFSSPNNELNNFQLIALFEDKKSNQIDRSHIRRNFEAKDETEEKIGMFCQDTISFLNFCGISEEIANEVAEIIAELAINMNEHGKENFSVEVHVTDSFKEEQGKITSGKLISITVYNLSTIKLYTSLKEMINNDGMKSDQQHLYRAKEYHTSHLDESYKYEDFLIVSAFQRNISSRQKDNISSGTGLTRVLLNLFDRIPDDDLFSYVLSGRNLLKFDKKLIIERDIDNIRQIGFNKSGKYLNDVPEMNALSKTEFYYNGTMFYLRMFIEE